MPVLQMELMQEEHEEDEESFDASPQDTEPAEPAESTAFLQRPKMRPCLVEFMMLTPRRRLGLGVILCGLSLALLAVLLAGSIPSISQPRHRAHAGRFRLSLWSGEGSCRSMGCESDNYVGSCQCNDGCTYFDDCCPDYQEVCTSAGQYEPPEPRGSCQSMGCGSDAAGCTMANCANLCQCIPSCREAGNCCHDFEMLCMGGGGGGGGGSEGGRYDREGEAGDGDADSGQYWDGDGDKGDDGEEYGHQAPHDPGPSFHHREGSTTSTEATTSSTLPQTSEPTTVPSTSTASSEHKSALRHTPSHRIATRKSHKHAGSTGGGSYGQEPAGSTGGGSYGQVNFEVSDPWSPSEWSSDFDSQREDMLELLKWQQVKACPAQVVNRDIPQGQNARIIQDVPTAGHCQRMCTESDCDASVWGAVRDVEGLSDVCFLKKVSGPPDMTEKQGVIAALPCCRPGQEGQSCPRHMLQTDAVTENGFAPMQGITSANACQEKCTNTEGCATFSWGAARNVPGLSDVCFMKKLNPNEKVKLVSKKETIAGLPCGCRTPASQALWPRDEAHIFRMPKPPSPRPASPGSCFCTALMRAYSYEMGMMTQQYNQKLGIFACTGFAVYSNQEMVLAEGLITKKVYTSQMCETGGEFKTALNLRIFAAYWKQLFVDGDFLNYNYVIKADADTVFLFNRLPPLLAKYDDRASGYDGKGVYFNNCKYGMHGPLEVFSQNAVLALWGLFETCYYYFLDLCSGDCNWGEDLWCDQCLKRKANRTIDRVNLYDLLQERHCDPPKDWDSCTDPDVVAFHPFKSVETWQACHDNTL
ncbi:endou [Symbiodinium sp. CCMP2456]|nr:endou [Symbiodinium sp. CCMP2456]